MTDPQDESADEVRRVPIRYLVLAQDGLWVSVLAVPLFVGGIAAGPLADRSSAVLLAVGLGLVVPMLWRLRRVGVYIADQVVVVRNVLWTHHLAGPICFAGWRSSRWSIKGWDVAVLRSESTGRRCKVLACQDPEDWDELRDELVARGLISAPRRASRRVRARTKR